jgi:hypothetical protein
MHGAGIVAMGFVMDAIADRHRRIRTPTAQLFVRDLEVIASDCRWTDGYWDFGSGNHVKWCDLQNTSRHIQLLTDFLLSRYRRANA